MLKRTIWFALMAAALATGCRATGQTITQDFAAPLPDAIPAPVVLDIATGTLNLTPVDAGGIAGKVTTNVEDWTVAVSTDASGALRITQGRARNQVIPNAANQWDVTLSREKPVNLTINAAAAGGTLDLTGLALPQLVINGGTGSFALHYGAPAPVAGATIAITQAGGDVTATGLLNGGLSLIESTATAGTQTFEFTGVSFTENLRATITTTAASVVLRIPARVPTRVVFNTTTGTVRDMPGTFTRVTQNTFENAEYADADQPRLLIEIQTVTGGLRVFELGGL